LRGQIAEQQSQLAAARSMAGRQPEVEAELAQLNRDYEVVRKNYEQLVTRREQASLGEKIDETTKVADFRVVEPPRVTPQPVKPNRMMVALFGLIAAFGAGVATTFGLSQLFPTVNNARQLKSVSGRPVLGSVSLVVNPHTASATRKNNQLFGLALGSLFLMHVAVIVIVKLHLLP
jgi:hypothetical protein